MAFILLACKMMSKDGYRISIPEESTVQCLKTVKDPKERLVRSFNS